MASPEDRRKALNRAYGLLKHRPRSSAEVSAHLAQLGYDAETVSATLDTLAAAGHINDEAFALAWTDSRLRFRPRSKWLIRRELESKGIDADTALNATDGVDDYATALQLARRRAPLLRGLERPTFVRRLMRFLASRGYDRSVCTQVVMEVLNEDSS